MQEIARVTLENEMDLILAHKRSMKLAELSGLSLSAQTTFATAVSEVSRSTIENGKNGCLILSVSLEPKREKFIVASIKDEYGGSGRKGMGLEYAKRLVNRLNVSETGSSTIVELYFALPPSSRIDPIRLESWKEAFSDEPPISPYDEIKRKNEQLRELAQKLQESESKYKTLTNSLPLIIFSLDPEGRVTFANEWVFHFTGIQVDEPERSDWRAVIHEDDQDAFSVLLNEKITQGSSAIKTQCRLRQADTGAYVWHLISVTPLKDEKNQIVQWIGYGVDIHAQKVYEATLKDNRELKETKRQLETSKQQLELNVQELNRSNQELQQFAFIASHDLQEPVRKVAYFSDLLLNKYSEAVDENGRRYLSGLFLASNRMRSLIKDVLSFSQVNRESLRLETVDLNELLKEVLADFELTITEKGAKIQADPLPMIEGDRNMMAQVFGNLVSNALKYAQQGQPPRLSVRMAAAGEQARISFEDKGIGFDEKYAGNLFRLFQRLHSREQYEGTGLGLAICRKIVELHHGSITATGKPGHGSVFTLTLPLKQNFISTDVVA